MSYLKVNDRCQKFPGCCKPRRPGGGSAAHNNVGYSGKMCRSSFNGVTPRFPVIDRCFRGVCYAVKDTKFVFHVCWVFYSGIC